MTTAYYEHGGITIYHGDCREIMPQLGLLDHIITDPPYSEHVHGKQWISHALTNGKSRVGGAGAFKELGFSSLRVFRTPVRWSRKTVGTSNGTAKSVRAPIATCPALSVLSRWKSRRVHSGYRSTKGGFEMRFREGVTHSVNAKMEAVNANVLREDGLLQRTCEHGVKHPVGNIHTGRVGAEDERVHGLPSQCCEHQCCVKWTTGL